MGNMSGGYLYIITNDAFEGWVKIGTTENLTKRLHTYQTGDPFRRYRIVYSICHPKFRQAEEKLKETMKYFALERKNEWYKVDLNMAKSRLDEQLEEYMST
jgi:predicted GIY-YIG superfamily endonuclease